MHYHASGTPGVVNTVEWEFTGLTPGVYDVSATWYANTNRATDAPYTVYDGGGTPLDAVDINQRLAPNDSTTPDGTAWELIFDDVTVSADGTLVIELSDQANNYVIADAIMVQYVGVPLLAADTASPSAASAVDTLQPADLQPALAIAKDLWLATGLTEAETARLDAVNVGIAALPDRCAWLDDDRRSQCLDRRRRGRLGLVL